MKKVTLIFLYSLSLVVQPSFAESLFPVSRHTGDWLSCHHAIGSKSASSDRLSEPGFKGDPEPGQYGRLNESPTGGQVAAGTFAVTTRAYVTQSGAGSMDGSSWTNAYSASQLRTAISTATEVWVAAGTYYPTPAEDPNNQGYILSIPSGLKFYGGFSGTETDISQRNIAANPTIISGDIGTPGDNSDNSDILLDFSNAAAGTVLDGFVISDSHNGYTSGAVIINSSTVEISNCHFKNNYAYSAGGLSIGNSTVTVDRCKFENNFGGAGGGGIRLGSSTVTVKNSILLNNNGGDSGGGCFAGTGADIKFVNCLFNGNAAYNYSGSAIYTESTAILRLTNCTVVKSQGLAAFGIAGQSAILENSIVWANDAGSGSITSGVNSIIQGYGPDPMFAGPDDFHLLPCSPAANTGDTALIAGYTTDLDGNPRDYNGFGVDMGAYELQDTSIRITPYAVGGGGAECNNSLGPVTLSNSQQLVSYQLKFKGNNVGSPVSGTGAALSLSVPAATGVYTVSAVSVSGCTGDMSGSAKAWVGPFETSLEMDEYLSGNDITMVTDSGRPLSSIVWKHNGNTVFSQPDGFEPDGTTLTSGFWPSDVFIAPGDTMYVAEASPGYRVTKWAPGATQGIVVAGGNGEGTALNQFGYPSSVWVDAARNVYVSDFNNHRVVKWAPGDTVGVVVAGNSTSGSSASQLHNPHTIAMDNAGNLYITDWQNHRVQKWAPGDTTGVTVAGGNGEGSANHQLAYPRGVWVAGNGDVYIGDYDNDRVMKWTPGATSGSEVPIGGTTLGLGYEVQDLRLDGEGRLLFSTSNSDLLRWKPGDSKVELMAGGNGWGSGANQLTIVTAIEFNASGELVLADVYNNRIQKYAPGVNSQQLLADTCGSWSTITTDAFGCVDTSSVIQVLTRWYADSDGDGYGNATTFQDACQQLAGFSLRNDDCNDNNDTIHPGTAEECNDGIDNNCDGIAVETPLVAVFDTLLTGCSGEVVQMYSTTGAVRWYDDPVAGNLIGQDSIVDIQLSVTDTIYAEPISIGLERLGQVNTDSALFVVNSDSLSGDDGRGIAVTPDYIYYSGDDKTVRYDPDLKNGVQLPLLIDGMFSDLATGKLYGFLYRDTANSSSYFSTYEINCFVEYDSNGVSTGDTTDLSMPIKPIGCSNTSIFNGSGYVLLYAALQKKVFRIDLPSGNVTVVKKNVNLDSEFQTAESCWSWNMSSYINNEYSIIYRKQGAGVILQLNLATEESDTVAVFKKYIGSDQSAQFVYSPWHGRLYWHTESGNEYNNQQSGEWLFAHEASGISLVQCGRTPALVLSPTPCPAPDMTVIRASDAPLTSALLAWEPPITCNDAVKTEIYFSSSSTPPGSSTTPTYENITADSFLVGYLQPDSTYYAWFRSKCGAGHSEWEGPVSYTMPSLDSLLVTTSPGSLCDSLTFSAQVELPQTASVAWYDAPVGGNQLDTGATASLVADFDGALYAEITVLDSAIFTQQFGVTGSQQMFIVPTGVSKISVTAKGARGGMPYYNCGSSKGYGKGGTVQADLGVTAGDTLYLYVGGVPNETSYDSIGTGGYNGGGGGDYYGGGGGGATDVRKGGNGLANRVLVAGGGGGASYCIYEGTADNGGAGGGLVGGDGLGYYCADCGGKGGTQSAGGAGGTGDGTYDGTPGGLGYGGSIPDPYYYYAEVGGGGGGYYGGGSGGSYYSGGGGGSSYADSTLFSNVVHTQGNNDGPGSIILNFYVTRAYSTRILVPVADTVAPTAVCQDVTVTLDASGNGTLVATAVDNNSTDTCGIASRALDISSFDCDDVTSQVAASNTVTLTVTDVNGNSATCTSNVTVTDNTSPVANCKNATVTLDATGNGTLAATAVDNNSTDACGIASRTLDISTFDCNDVSGANVSANTVTLTVTDNNGNSATCTATVTVTDNTAPAANCKNAMVTLDAQGNGTLTTAAVNNNSTDACGIASTMLSQTSFTCANAGSSSVTLTVTDVNGNSSSCTATVTVTDSNNPVANCKNASVTLDASGNGTLLVSAVDNNSTDPCGIASRTLNISSFDCDDVSGANASANIVTLTVTDNGGNSATCTATVTVTDNTVPVAACKNTTVTLDAQGNGSTTAAAVNNNSTDACGIASTVLSQTTFTCANVGANSVTLTVTDNNGNSSSCTSTVTVTDNTVPAAACKNAAVTLDAQGNGSITVAAVNNNSTDACGIASTTLSQSAFTCVHVGANTVILTVTDNNSNASTCSATVTVSDNTAPAANCKNATIQLNAAGQASLSTAQVNNNSSDNCSFSTSISQTAFSCAQLGANTVTLTVTDASSNSSTCTATVTVQDNILPVAICKNATLYLDASGAAGITADQINNGSSDNCGPPSLALSKTSFSCANLGANAVMLTATDPAGNSTTCNGTVTVVDDMDPILVCQDITVQVNTQGQVSITPSQVFNAAASSDNCGAVNLTGVSTTQLYCNDVGPNTVTLSANDGHGNTSNCQATVTVLGLFPTVNINVTPEVCGDSPGTITVNLPEVNGQVAYSINGGNTWQFSNVFSSVSAGNYNLAINVFGSYGCGVPPQTITVPAIGEVTNTWSGNGNEEDWTKNSNWSLGIRPLPCHDVVIPPGSQVVLPAGAEGHGRTLTVEQGATLTVEDAAVLLIQKF